MSAPDSYTCMEVFRRLDDYLGRALAPDELLKVEAHLRTCEVCAAEYRFETRLVDEVRGKLREAELPDELRGRIAALLAPGAPRESEPR
jgi:anti-sigma factor (TIGR02949 family)